MVLTWQQVILVFSGVLPIRLHIIDMKPFFFINPLIQRWITLAGFSTSNALYNCFCASIAPNNRPLIKSVLVV